MLSCYQCWVLEQRVYHPQSSTLYYLAPHRKACWPLHHTVVRHNSQTTALFSYCSLKPLLFLTFHHYSFSSSTCPQSPLLFDGSWFAIPWPHFFLPPSVHFPPFRHLLLLLVCPRPSPPTPLVFFFQFFPSFFSSVPPPWNWLTPLTKDGRANFSLFTASFVLPSTILGRFASLGLLSPQGRVDI